MADTTLDISWMVKVQDNATKILDQLDKTVSGLNQNVIKMGDSFDGAGKKPQKSFRDLSLTIITLNQALELARKGYSFLEATMGQAISKAAEQEKVEALLINTLKNRGIYTQQLANANLKLAENISVLTGVDDDQIVNVERLLYQYGATQEQIEKLTMATIEFAIANDKDLNTAAQLVGKTLNGSGNALKKFGLKLGDTTTEAQRYNSIITALARFNGTAEASTNTFSGAQKVFTLSLGQAFKEIGNIIVKNELFINIYKVLGSVLQEVAKWFKENKTAIIDFINSGVLILANIIQGIVNIYNSFTKTIKDNSTALIAAAIVVGSLTTAIGIYILVINAASIATTAWSVIVAIATTASSAFAAVWAFITSPIFLVISALALVGIAVFALVKYWDYVTAAMKIFVGYIISYLTPALDLILSGAKSIVGIFSKDMAESIQKARNEISKLGTDMSKSGKEQLDALKNTKDAIDIADNSIIQFTNNLISLPSNKSTNIEITANGKPIDEEIIKFSEWWDNAFKKTNILNFDFQDIYGKLKEAIEKAGKDAEFAKGLGDKIQAGMGVISGGAQSIKSAATGALMSSGNPYAMAAGAVVEIFGKTKEEFTKWIDGIINMVADLPTQIADNVPIFIEKIIQSIPRILNSLNAALPLLLDNLIAMLSKPEFWQSVIDALISIMLYMMGNPQLWIISIKSFINALINGIPAIINGFIKGFSGSFGKIFENLGRVFSSVGKIFNFAGETFKTVGFIFEIIAFEIKIAIDIFKSAVDFFKSIIDTLISTFSGGGLFGGEGGIGGFIKGGGFLGGIGRGLGLFEYGGIIDKLQKAQSGLIIGNSYHNDKTLVRANAGEMILTKDQQQNLFSMINDGFNQKPQTIVVNLTVGKDKLAETIVSLQKSGYRMTA